MARHANRYERDSSSDDSHPRSRKSRLPRRPRGRFLLVILCLGLLAIGLAPSMIALTPARDWPLAMIFEGIDGTIQSRGASLGWFSRVHYDGIEIRDRKGELVVDIQSLDSEKSLSSILLDTSSPGLLRLQKPEITVRARPDGSNLEDVLLPWWNAPSNGNLNLGIEVSDGQVRIDDTVVAQRWLVDDLAATVNLTVASNLPTDWSASGKVINQDGPPSAGVPASFQLGSTKSDGPIDLKTDRLPLEMFRWAIARFDPTARVSGQLTSSLSVQPPDNNAAAAMRGSVVCEQLFLSGGMLGSDQFRLSKVTMPCDLSLTGDRLQIKQLDLLCDVGQVATTCDVKVPSTFDAAAVQTLLRQSYTANGHVDLARLAQLIPQSLHIKQDTKVTSGKIQFAVTSTPGSGTPNSTAAWKGTLDASDLAAVDARGQTVRWQQPVKIEMAMRDSNTGPIIDALSCDSQFLKLNGKGNLENLSADVQLSLDQLVKELGQFVDFGTVRLAGDGTGQINWSRNAAGTFQTSAKANVRNLLFATSDKDAWRESDLTVDCQAAGALTGAWPTRIDQLNVQVLAVAGTQQDTLRVQLNEPATNPLSAEKLAVTAQLTGQLARWRTRLAPWVDLSTWQLTGDSDLLAKVTYTAADISVHSLKGEIQNLHLWGNGLFMDEPRLQIDLAGRYENGRQQLTLGPTSVLIGTMSIKTDQASITVPTAGPIGVLGKVLYQADIAQLQRWTYDPRTAPPLIWSGRLGGQADLSLSGQKTNATVQAKVDDLAVYGMTQPVAVAAPPAAPAASVRTVLWQEKELRVNVDGSYDSAADSVQARQIQVGSQALTLQAAGSVDKLSSVCQLNLNGQLDFDWQTVSRLLQPYLGPSIRIEGRESRQFAVRGPIQDLISPKANSTTHLVSQQPSDPLAWIKPIGGEAAIGWQKAEAYGMPLGKADIQMRLQNGAVKVDPIDMQLGEGRLKLAPNILLTPAPAELVLGPGLAIDRVRVSPEMTATWLKYVAPAMADATRADGTLSVNMQGAKVPLFQPERSDIAGQLLLHKLEVTPGPASRPLILLVQQIRAITKRQVPPAQLTNEPVLMRMTERKIDFRMVDGKVYHQGMEMQIGDVVVRTRGWVDMNQNMQIMAEIPVLDSWIGSDPILAGMKGKVLEIPISGKIGAPQFDGRVVQQLGAQLLQGATRGVIEGELNKQFDKLFGR